MKTLKTDLGQRVVAVLVFGAAAAGAAALSASLSGPADEILIRRGARNRPDAPATATPSNAAPGSEASDPADMRPFFAAPVSASPGPSGTPADPTAKAAPADATAIKAPPAALAPVLQPPAVIPTAILTAAPPAVVAVVPPVVPPAAPVAFQPPPAVPAATGTTTTMTLAVPAAVRIAPAPSTAPDAPAAAGDAAPSDAGMFFDLFRKGSTPARPVVRPAAAAAPVPIASRPVTNATPTATALARDRLEEGIALAREQRHAEAIPILEEVIRLEPTSVPAWEQLGWCYWSAGRKEDTVVLWKRLLALDPGNPAAYSLLARAAVSNNDLEKAIEYNRKSLELNPNQPNVRFDLARTLLWHGSSDDAMPMLESVMATDPNRIDVILELARARTYAWQYESALPLWLKLRETAPDEPSYMAAEAICRLHSNEPEAARELATRVLDVSPDDAYALDVMACLSEYGTTPADALPYLRRMMDSAKDLNEKERWRVRLIKLHIRLNRDQPRVHGLREAVALTRERIEFAPYSVDAHLLLGELQMMDGMLADAERQFIKVLRDFNPYNIRARRALLETYLAARQYDSAREQLAAISRFNPFDPYLYYQLARLESGRGDFYKAHEAIDKLEAAGQRGAVAVLLYHGLSKSSYFADGLSTDRLRDHIAALQKARARIVKSSELPGLLGEDRLRRETSTPVLTGAGFGRAAGAVPLTVAISFDDARRDSMKHGTEIAKDMGVVFSMHVPVGYILRNHAFISTWEMLQNYQKEGCWEFGGHMLDGAILAPVDSSGREWHALPNLNWLKDQQRMETIAEYDRRLATEFSEGRKVLMENLGGPANFMAYPFGDIGQEDETNVDDPTGRILTQARRNFEVGFIQSVFGYAVAGDDPLLYQRHEMDRWMDGQDVVDYLYQHHPVYLARRLRAEYSALEGKLYRAREALESLENSGYPERPLEAAKKYVADRLPQSFGGQAPGPGSIAKSPWTIEIRKPYAGVTGQYFQDNQDRRNWRITGMAGVNVTPNLLLEGRAGIGRLTQDVAELSTNFTRVGRTTNAVISTRDYRIDIDERTVGGKAVITLPSGIYLAGDILQRSFSGDVDRERIAWAVETQVRPFQPFDILIRYEEDMAPSALAIAEDIDYGMWTAVGNLRVRDNWNIVAAGTRYDFSDDNTRDHFTVGSMWTVHPRTGLRLGVRFSYDTSDEESLAYWTPYHLQRYYAEGGFQGNYLRTYYNLRLRLGIGREDARPEEEQRYQETVARAKALNFDPGPAPGEDWEPVFGLAASANRPFGEHWAINGEFSYNKNPNYNEISLLGGLRYKF